MTKFFFFKKRVFKFLEKGLGLKTVFRFQPENSLYMNFSLSEAQANTFQKNLPTGYELKKLRICEEETEEKYWISYNVYHLDYGPKFDPSIRRTRCEINAFVENKEGQQGCWVCQGSPFVDDDIRWRSPMSVIASWAERLVMWCYGSGRFSKLRYSYTQNTIDFSLKNDESSLNFAAQSLKQNTTKFTSQFLDFNTYVFFSDGTIRDDLFFNNKFSGAIVNSLRLEHMEKQFSTTNPLLTEGPSSIYVVEGKIPFLVDALNRVSSAPKS